MSDRGVGRGPGNKLNSNIDIRGGAIGTLVAVGIIVLVVLIALINSYTVVQAGERGVVKRFGEITDTFGEGLHFRTPFITDVTMIDVRTQRYVSDSSAASKDLQIVTTQVVLNYSLFSDEVDQLVRTIGTEYESKIIDPAIQEAVKAATAQFNAEQLITLRPQVSETIQEELRERLDPRGIEVEDLSITEFRFSEEFARAIESKQVAEQEALRAQRELERVRFEAEQRVARAEADADARLVEAQAEAEALRLQREVISPALLQLRFIEKWDGVLPRLTAGDSGILPMLTIPAEDLQEAQAIPEPEPTATPEPEPTSPPVTDPEAEPEAES